jgi:probable O-glycosylation ligase (exosortase A-associated)
MNPQNLIYGNYEFLSYAMFVAVATMSGLIFNVKQIIIPKNIIFYLALALFLYFTLTTSYAMNGPRAWEKWQQVGKIYVMVVLMCCLINDKEKFRYLLIVVAMSIGYYGFQGAVTTILTGGKEIIYGDFRSSLGDNNTLGMAELMVIPLMLALGQTAKRNWKKWAFYGTAAMCMISVPASYSRGAVVGQVALVGILWLKSSRKILYGALAIGGAAILILLSPPQWHDRMMTIFTYQEDNSAMARVYGPIAALRIAKDKPFLGGGFGLSTTKYYEDMFPEAGTVDIHNSFFQLLSEHGFIALGIFLVLIGFSLLVTHRIARDVSVDMELRKYAEGLFAGIIPYIIAGSFMPRAYIEMFYIYIGAIVILSGLASVHPADRVGEGTGVVPGN